jgi:predicted 3-demethylubiquinone-9 3-methyltransferase (glyoxalase superfamily)
MAEPVFNTRVTELASRIYVDLVGNAVTVTEGSAKVATDPERLAKVSFKLAEAFHRVLDELNAENLPKNVGFTVQVDDIANWNK